MSKLLVKRMRLLLILGLVALVIGGVAWWQLHDQRRLITARIDKLQQDSNTLTKTIHFGDFTTQNIDDYLLNLNNKLTALDDVHQIYELQLAHTDLFPGTNTLDIAGKLRQLEAEQERYQLDQGYMAINSYDYKLLGLYPDTQAMISHTIQLLGSIGFNLQQTLLDPLNKFPGEYYVQAGQMVGMQGCTGVCSGTHVHFVVADNGVAKDPCLYLPKRELSRWGMIPNCGVASGAQIGWPEYISWIVTDTFDDVSPVTHIQHGALDVIDRQFAPVIAANAGWYLSRKQKCTGAVICNDGAANIVTVCENTDCDKDIHTDYWHLAWMVDESPVVALPAN